MRTQAVVRAPDESVARTWNRTLPFFVARPVTVPVRESVKPFGSFPLTRFHT